MRNDLIEGDADDIWPQRRTCRCSHASYGMEWRLSQLVSHAERSCNRDMAKQHTRLPRAAEQAKVRLALRDHGGMADALRSHRWEDYDYEYLHRADSKVNRFSFLGNGYTVAMGESEVHRASADTDWRPYSQRYCRHVAVPQCSRRRRPS